MFDLFPVTRFRMSQLDKDFSNLSQWSISTLEHMDSMFKELDVFFDKSRDAYVYPEPSKYPPTNILQTETGYTVELAVAGYSSDDLEVSLENNILTVKGEKIQNEVDEGTTFVRKGISSKSFTRSFTIPKNANISSTQLKNGLLSVGIEVPKPKEEKVEKLVFDITE